jgi:hypothetical protein
MIRKAHPKVIPNDSLGMLISAIELVAVHAPAKTSNLLTTT